MSRAALIFPGLRGRAVASRERVEFGAVPVLSIALAATNFVPLLASSKNNPKPEGKKPMSPTPCGCRPTPEPGPWCPYRRARVEARRAAETFGAALRGEPQAKARVSRIAQAAPRDPRAARAAQKLDDAGKARAVAKRAHRGDKRARAQVDRMREGRDASVQAAEACSMVEYFLDLPPSELEGVEVMAHQFDADRDGWLFDEFSGPQLATALIDSDTYDWPV